MTSLCISFFALSMCLAQSTIFNLIGDPEAMNKGGQINQIHVLNGALWYMGQVHCRISDMDLLFQKQACPSPGMNWGLHAQIAKFICGQHGSHLGPAGPRRAPCWPHEPCYEGGIWLILPWKLIQD